MELLPLEDDLADRLAERTEGHPLFAMQLLGHWIEEDAIEMSPEGFRVAGEHQLDVPDDVHELWMRRLHHLVAALPDDESDARWAALEMAAALGRQIDGEEWRAVCERCGLERPARLRDALVERGLAERTDQGWAFAHGLLVDSLEQRARESGRWQTHHRHCAELLERLEPDHLARTAARRADHYIEAGELERAVAPLRQESARAKRVGDMHRARQALERREQLLDALEAPDGDVRRLESALQTAHMHLMVGEPPEEVLHRLREVKTRAEEADLPRLVARAWRWIALCHDRLGHRREAVDCCRRAADIAGREGDDEAVVQALMQRAWLEQHLGDLEAADEHLREARRRTRSAETPYREFQARHHLAWLALARGDVGEAVEHFEAVLETSRTHGYRRLEMRCLNGLGEVARFRGEASKARRCYRRYRRANRELNLPDAVATAELNLAQVELMAGRFAEAAEWLERSARRFEEIAGKSGQLHLIRLVRLARAAGIGQWREFDDIFRHYRNGWPQGGTLLKDHPWLLEMAGDYAAQAGEPDRARRAWRLARELWGELDDQEAVERLDELLAG